MIRTNITPMTPIIMRTADLDNTGSFTALYILSAILLIIISVLIGFIITNVMKSKGILANRTANLIGSGVVALGLFLRFGLSATLFQGLFLFFVLLYAAMSDLTSHEVDDCLWIIVLALALVSVPTIGLTSMLTGALCVFVPQMALALLPPHKTLGGADIKLSTALAFLLGFPRGIFAYLIGLAVAVVYMLIYNKFKKRCAKKPFALVPFFGIGAMILFFV